MAPRASACSIVRWAAAACWCRPCLSVVCAPTSPSRCATTIDRTDTMRARLLLAVIVFPAFTLTAQQQGGTGTSRATAGLARLRQAHARSASIDDKRVITPASASGARILERLRLALLLGV